MGLLIHTDLDSSSESRGLFLLPKYEVLLQQGEISRSSSLRGYFRRNPFYEPPLHKAFYHPSLGVDIETQVGDHVTCTGGFPSGLLSILLNSVTGIVEGN